MAFSFRARDDAHSPKPKHLPWKDYAPPEAEAAEKAIEHFRGVLAPTFTALADCPVDLEEIEKELERDRLSEIKALISSLTYGEMMELAAALWKMRPENKEITEQELPGILHRWSSKP